MTQPCKNSKKEVNAFSICSVAIQIWRCADATGLWQEEEALPGHSDWVRDVAWAPNMGLPRSTIASAGQDGQVRKCRSLSMPLALFA